MPSATRCSAVLTLAGLLLAAGALVSGCSIDDPYTGEPFTRTEKIETRRHRPTKEERERAPKPPYEDTLRAEQAEKDRLEVPRDIHEKTKYLEQTERTTKLAKGPGFGPAHDPWMSYEDDRRRTLARTWADTGKPEPSPVEPKKERVTEDDPYAPAPKVGKKDAAEGEGEKKADDEKKPEGDKKGD